MTDAPAASPDRAAAAPAGRRAAASRRPAAIAWGGSGLAFVAVLGVLAWQVAAGADPAIGDGEQAAAAPAAKRIVKRRIVRRVIVTHEAPVAPAVPKPPRI